MISINAYFTSDHDVELLDTLKSELLFLDQDSDGISHELFRDVQHIRRHGGRQQDDLYVVRHLCEHVVDLFLETARQHLVGLVQDEQFDALRIFKTNNNCFFIKNVLIFLTCMEIKLVR